jgi:plasmid stabilization system protein ParE
VNTRLFAPRAHRDLCEASLWLARTNPAVAHALVAEAERAARRLAERPMWGRRRPDLLPEPFRFWTLRGFPYLLAYDVWASPPRVLLVLHASRDLPSALAEFPA